MFRTKTNYTECNLEQCNIGDWTNHTWRTGKLGASWLNWDGTSNVRAILAVWKHRSPVLSWSSPNVSPNVHEANQMRINKTVLVSDAAVILTDFTHLSYARSGKCGDNIYKLSVFTCTCFRLPIINPLQTKRRPLHLKTQSVPRSKHFLSRL